MARAMKDTGIPWIGIIPSHWETMKVKYSSWLKGRIGWQGLTANEYVEDGPFLVTGTDFHNGKINWDSCVHITKERFDEDLDIHIQENDLLITKDGTVGKVAIAENCPTEVSLNSGVLLIRNTGTYKYDKKYLYYVLLSDEFWKWYTLSQTGQSTIKHLYQAQFYNFEYSYPPIEEQEQIAAVLDAECSRINAVIDKTRASIKEYKKLKQAVITQAVTKGIRSGRNMKDSGIEWIGEIPEEWGTIKIKYTSWLKGRIGWQGLTASEYIDEGPFLVTGTDFMDGLVNWASCAHISKERFDEDKDIHIKEGDLLITKDGTVGKVAIAKDCPKEVSLNSGVLLIRNVGKYKYYDKYLYYVLLSDEFWRWYTLSQTGQSTIMHLYQAQFYSFEFTYPSLEEQQNIADYLDEKCMEIDRLIVKKEHLLSELESYKKSLIYEYVTGKKEVPECQ